MSEHELKEIEIRLSKVQNGPWKAFIERRDFESGSSFIMTGLGDSRNNDIEFIGATIADIDFIANSRQDIPKLIAEIRRQRNA